MQPLLPLLLSLAPQDTAAEDWPRFRGPGGAGQGAASALPATVREGDIAWRVPLPGPGHSSPVVLGERIVLTCSAPRSGDAAGDGDGGGPVRLVLALSTTDGAELWRHREPLDVHGQHRLNSFASSTAALADGRAHFAWPSGDRLVALTLDLEDGEVLWRADLGPFGAQHGGGASPVVAAGVVVVPNDHEAEGRPSAIVGLDAETGEERWRRPRDTVRAAYATPGERRAEDGVLELVFASSAHGLTALDPRDGSLRWGLEELFEERCVGSPVLAGGLVFASAGRGGGGVEAVAVRPPAGEDGPEVVWSGGRALPYVPTAVSDGERLYQFSDGGIVSCVDAATGEERWRERVDGSFFGSPVLADGKLFAMTTDGALLTLAAEDAFAVLGRTDLGAPTQATPAVAGGRLYLRTERELLCVAPRK